MGGDLRARWLRGAACAVSLALAAGQEPQTPDEASPADKGRAEIDRLIEKLESLDAFRAEYEGSSSEGAVTLVLEYAAPGSARLLWLECEELVADVTIVDGVMALRRGAGVAEENQRAWQVDLHSIFARWTGAIEDALRARAPALAAEFRPHSAATKFGPRFYLGLRRPSEDEGAKTRIDVGLQYELSTCSPFHWLCTLRQSADQLVIGEERISIEVDEAVLEISTATGFVTAYTADSGDARRDLKLTRLLLDDEVPGAGISVPADVPEAPDGLKQTLHASAVGMACAFVTGTLGRAADDGSIEWDAEAQASLTSALQAFFGVAFEFMAEDYVDAQKKRIDERSESLRTWVQKQREEGRDPEEIRTDFHRIVEEGRTSVESTVERVRDEIVAAIFDIARPSAEGRVAEAREIERSAAMKAWEDTIRGPVLSYFETEFVEPWKD